MTNKRSNHEILITKFMMKINIHVIFSNFMKILNHEKLDLYGTYGMPVFTYVHVCGIL